MAGALHTLKFILRWAVVGLAIAFLVVLLREWQRPPAPTPAAKPVETSAPGSFAAAVIRTSPAVVNIFTRRADKGGRGNAADSYAQRALVLSSLGSGVIVDAQGNVITNNHVVACADEISVQLADGRMAAAAIVGTDPETDIAVLRIQAPNLPVAPLGNSDDLRRGDVVLAIGNPYGLSQTVTHGIVSGTGRGQLGVTTFENFIQTDAAINQGNSGGALINTYGELIGINTAALSQTLGVGVNGISFAIPVNLVRGVMEQLVEFGRVKRGWFGVETQGLVPQQAATLGLDAKQGLLITRVYPDSPAAHAGLQRGDVIVGINGQERDIIEALNLVAGTPPGQLISVSVLRDERRVDLRVTLVEREMNRSQNAQCDAVE